MSQDKEQALTPLEEKTVDFYGDEITAALVQTGSDDEAEVLVPLRPLSDYLGLAWSGQFERIKRDPVLSKVIRSVRVTRTEGGGRRDVVCLPLKYLTGWLFRINSERVKPELREKIIRYQEECYDVLWRAFRDETIPFGGSSPRPPVEREPNQVLVQIREQALALAKLAEQQMEIEARAMDAQDQAYYAHQRLDEFGRFVNRLNLRVGDLEQVISPGAPITTQQATAISQAVKALAEYLTGKLGPTDAAGRVHYQSIFGELYRRFGVFNYREIQQRDYQAVLDFLTDWRRSAEK